MKSSRAIRIITSLSVGVVAIAAISWLGLGQVSGQISRIDVFANLKDRPEKTSQALNYLVVGSDNREGLTKEQIKALRVGSTKVAAGGRSDTMLLVHISKSRDSAYIVSIPATHWSLFQPIEAKMELAIFRRFQARLMLLTHLAVPHY